MAPPLLSFAAARDAVRGLVASLDAGNASLLADLERARRDTAGDTAAFLVAVVLLCPRMAGPTLAASASVS